MILEEEQTATRGEVDESSTANQMTAAKFSRHLGTDLGQKVPAGTKCGYVAFVVIRFFLGVPRLEADDDSVTQKFPRRHLWTSPTRFLHSENS
jgi:hypothetical protein